MEGKNYPDLNQFNEKPHPGNPPPYTASGVYPHPESNPSAYNPGFSPQEPIIMTPGVAVVQGNVVPAVVVTPGVGPKPVHLTCRSCHQLIVTRVESKSTTKTHLMALLLCFLGCWPCVCIPYCTDSCMNADHFCPKCNAYIGSYSN